MEVVLGYSQSKGQYHVEEIHGNDPVATYQRSSRGTTGPVQIETVRVGDWLTEEEASKLAVTSLIVRPYEQQGG